MPVNRKLWKEPLTNNYVPNWHCSACAGGYLKHKPGSLHFLETSESRKAHHHEAWDQDWIEYRFSALLVCNNEHCQGPVAVAGCGRVEMVQTSHNGDVQCMEFFYPQHMSPSPPIIAVSMEYPEPIVYELQKAFIASWGDFPLAGNQIRSAVERLLDFLKEPETKLSKPGKREPLTLHTRIASLATRDKELSESLLAVKWLGNVGSHSDELSREDIFDAFDILDLILSDLFVSHRARVKKLVSSINENKGPARDDVLLAG